LFSFDATPVMFVGLLVLFGWSAAWSIYELTRPQDSWQRVSNALHLAMAVVMLLMVAGPTWKAMTGLLPTPLLAGLFAAATGWFAWRAIGTGRPTDRGVRLHLFGHAAMFAAMTWHLAAMAAMAAGMAHGPDNGSGHGHAGGGMDAGGMDMGDWMTVQSQAGGVLWWFALAGLPLMAYLLAASLRSLGLAVRSAPRAAVPVGPATHTHEDGRAHQSATANSHNCHEIRPVGSAKFRLAALCDLAMTVGMFWMSTGLLAPLLPAMALLAF
jgi:hypothetical protein